MVFTCLSGFQFLKWYGYCCTICGSHYGAGLLSGYAAPNEPVLHPAAPILHPNAPNVKRKGYCKTIAGNWIIFWVIPHKRTLILIQRLAFFLCPESLAPQGFFQFAGCMERAFPLFFGCKRRLMLISPCFTLPVGCMIKRLLVVELVAVLYWVHMKSEMPKM